MTISLNLKWEDGIIGKTEDFFTRRLPINKMWGRALGTTLNSSAIHELSIYDKIRPVRPNVWFLYISSSGTGIKTPPIDSIRDILNEFDRNKVSVSKFTPEGYTERVTGTDEQVDKNGKIRRKAVIPHPNNVILRDEASVILGENKSASAFANQKEYLSKLWDGYIEGYYTRKAQDEGNVPVYVSLCAASSKYFYDLLEKEFFEQGTGNRIMWITQEKIAPKKLTPDFFMDNNRDIEFESLKKDLTEKLHYLEDNVSSAYLDLPAKRLWCDLQFEYANKATNDDNEGNGSYCVKMPLNCIKLAMNYAASVMSIDERVEKLMIKEEHMKLAIQDVKEYERMWRVAMQQWEQRKYSSQKVEKPLATNLNAMKDLMKIAILELEGFLCIREIVGKGNFTYRSQVSNTIENCVDKDWLIRLSEESLATKQLQRFTRGGETARVYAVTKKGRNENPVDQVLCQPASQL